MAVLRFVAPLLAQDGSVTGGLLRGRDPPNQVILLSLTFGSDREGIQQVQPEGVVQGFSLTAPQIAFSQNLHADYSLTGRFHFAYDGDYGSGVRVHMRANRVDPHKIDVYPG